MTFQYKPYKDTREYQKVKEQEKQKQVNLLTSILLDFKGFQIL